MLSSPQILGELPDGYEYKLFKVDGVVKVLGAAPDKAPIAFYVAEDNKLKEINLAVDAQ